MELHLCQLSLTTQLAPSSTQAPLSLPATRSTMTVLRSKTLLFTITALAALTSAMAATPAPVCASRMCLDNYVPVCGSNLKTFKTYASSCELSNAKCKDPALVLAYLGECTPEASTTWMPPTPKPTTAAPTPVPTTAAPTPAPTTMSPFCSSNPDCPDKDDPVCGSVANGTAFVTFANPCELNKAHCKDLTIVVAYKGECTPEASATWKPVTPTPPTAAPTPVSTTAAPTPATTVCTKRECPSVYKPVCGSDGVVYPSACELNNAKCDNPGLTTGVACAMGDM